ncbi:hypothetical protein GR204_34375 [Rhizobium leguminosarum]|uniref:Uncharacterized protein n=1 Tax=Rhizobium leguminosarum TaxID=384 RepID=A0A6P0BJT8_RHILE|nr:hypothetical protein [Rhizobium leguminosarum]NEI38961.1 hypothetical protein [Rhizobium leguminosarum]NEI45691.1 hypothetical protein [Rhizobium leguminosarum]
MAEENPDDDAVASSKKATPPRPAFEDEWRKKAKHVPKEIFSRAFAFFVAAFLVSLLLFFLKGNHTFVVVRELVFAELTRQQFPQNPPASKIPKINYLTVPEVGCGPQTSGDDSCGTGRVNKTTLASDVEAASSSSVNILIIDAAPSPETDCDADIRQLLVGIKRAVSSGKIVIMPRPLSTLDLPAKQMRTYFDVCRTDYPSVIDAEQKVFYGITTIEALPEIAVFSLMRVATTVDMPRTTGEHGNYRETPSLAIVAARALTDRTQDALRKSLDDAGLETRSHAIPGSSGAFSNGGANLSICNQSRKTSCEYEIDFGKMFRIKYGLDPTSRNHEVLRMVDPPSVKSTIPDQILLNVDINLIGADPNSTLDRHKSVVGPLAGGVNIANQIYAISNHLLLEEAATLETWLADLGVLLLAAAAAGVAAFGVLKCSCRRKYATQTWELEISERRIVWSWSATLLVVACLAAFASWKLISLDYENGVISFAIVGALLAFAKAVFLAENCMERLLETWLNRRVSLKPGSGSDRAEGV